MSLSGVAKETLGIIQRGIYTSPSGASVSLRAEIDRAIAGTRVFSPSELMHAPRGHTSSVPPRIEVTREKTGTAARRLVVDERLPKVAILNFASARNPGGGFLRGAKAQEEDLCRCSALYACLEPQRAFYDANRASESLLYTDHLIWSPDVPFFRDDRLDLLERPFCVSVITAPAPNAGEELRRRPGAHAEIRAALRRRAALVLALAARHEHRALVLGAWGCGVFRNDPREVADAFAQALEDASGSFDRVTFAVWERDGAGANFQAFNSHFGKERPRPAPEEPGAAPPETTPVDQLP